MAVSVLSVGGSIIAPDKVDDVFLVHFVKTITGYLKDNPDDRLIFVCGGGGPAREYQRAFRAVVKDILDSEDFSCGNVQDEIGIMATRINALFIKSVFGKLCTDCVVTNPTAEDIEFTGRILVASGWKPGFSTDTDAVYLARRFNASVVINLSNIAKVYTDDPRKNPDAKPIDSISWTDFRKIVGDTWVPGKNVPFDPVASRLAQESGLRVICADGHNTENVISILTGKSFVGTVIE